MWPSIGRMKPKPLVVQALTQTTALIGSRICGRPSVGGIGPHPACRIAIGGQRDVPEQEWLRQPHPSQEAERLRHVRDDAAGQPCEIENPRACRACVRRAKGSDGVIHQNYRDRPSDDQDRNGQSRLQHQTPYLSVQDRHRMTRLVVRKSDPFVANSNQAKSTGDGNSVAAAAAKVGTPDVLSAIRECPARGK